MPGSSLATLPTKTHRVITAMKAAITTGTLSPGERMASMRELAEHFDASFAVINSAYDVLEDEGFIVRQARSGTYVNPHFTPLDNRLVSLFTGFRRDHYDGYFEPFCQAAAGLNVIPMIGHLPEDGDWRQTMRLVLGRRPDLVLVDVEARLFPLQELLDIIGEVPVCFVNRWEWHSATPGNAILFDYINGYIQALTWLRDRGHRRILLPINHPRPEPYLQARIAAAAAAVGLRLEDELIILGDMDGGDWECLAGRVEDLRPTAIFGHSDHIVKLFFECIGRPYLAWAQDLDRIGFFDQRHSHVPEQEFPSIHLPFDRLWKAALSRACTPAAAEVTYLPVTLTINSGASS